MGIISSLFSQDNGSVKNLNMGEFEEGLKNDKEAVLIDVRTEMEHKEVRIPNSVLINIMDPNFKNEIDKLDRNKSYYLYCRSGNRSMHAGRMMAGMGFENVNNLKPGIIGWFGETERN